MLTPDVIQLNPITPASQTRSWLDYQHPEYRINQADWSFIYHMYTGDCIRRNLVQQYVVRKYTGEAQKAYEERCSLADYTNHLAAVLDTIAGMLFAVEGNANRTFNKASARNKPGKVVLGAFNEPETPIGKLFVNADGQGNGYQTLWKLLANDLMLLQGAWVLVDGADGEPFIRTFPLSTVPNWRYDGQGLAEVLVKEVVDTRESLENESVEQHQYIRFGRKGWGRYRKMNDGTPELVDSGRYSFVDRKGRPALPIFKAKLPLRRSIGWSLAHKAMILLNKESERDHLLRSANFPRLNLVADDALFDKMIDDLEKGSNILQVNPSQGNKAHHYIQPSAESAAIASKVLERKVEEFYVTAFRQYGDSAKEITATEARQDLSQGVGAFLQLLKSGVDDAENETLWRLEQVLFPRRREMWFVSSVERSDDFAPVDVEAAIKSLRSRYFGETDTVPAGRTALLCAAKEIARWDGVQVNDAELEAAIDARLLSDGMDRLGSHVPFEMIVQLVTTTLASLGAETSEEELTIKVAETISSMRQEREEEKQAEKDAAAAKKNAVIAKKTPPTGE